MRIAITIAMNAMFKNSVKGSMHGSSSSRISAQINAAFASGIMAPLQSTAATPDDRALVVVAIILSSLTV